MIKIDLHTIYKNVPSCFHNLFITGYNLKVYFRRYGGKYKEYRQIFNNNETLSLDELKNLQFSKLKNLLNIANSKSKFYREKFRNIDFDEISSVEDLQNLPIINKEILRKNIDDIVTISKKRATISKTGGTTGKSLVIYVKPDNTQFGFAMLDHFRSKYGYKLGRRTAWFSGKSLLNSKDINNHIFWKTDYLFNVRYYSTFHINQNYLSYYVNDLMAYRPEYLVGFPSSIYEIASYGLKNNINFPKGIVKAVFPTAETFTKDMRDSIEKFFNAKAYNQYASSEGAPFIFECSEGNLHMELQSGVFEVIDENNNPCYTGRLIVTSFTTEGTPLIRYDIGDVLTISENSELKCKCGNNNPIAKEILGRINDFIFSPENGKINLGNISNTLKGVEGIVNFQVIQNVIDKITIYIVRDEIKFSKHMEKVFLENWRDRVGQKMQIEIEYVKSIPVEQSGKYRLVKNNINDIIACS